jgi:hypothetical protein
MPMEARMSRKRTGRTPQTKANDPECNEQWAIDSSYVQDWIDSLDERRLEVLQKPIRQLQIQGPTLEYPFCKPIKDGVRNTGYFELRASVGRTIALRVIYAWDKEGTAVLLYGGDKAGIWDKWYPKAVRIASQNMNEYKERAAREMNARMGNLDDHKR